MTGANTLRFHPEVEFGGFTDIDSTVIFYARVQQLLAEETIAVDVGCGRGTQRDDPVRLRRELRVLRGKCCRVIGIDVDAAAADNPFVDEFRQIGSDGRWPLDDASADLAVADFVLEHVTDPNTFFGEAARVLRPGATICIRTINAWSYVGLASRFVPNGFHARLLRDVQPERQQQDVFPTVYRCNSVPKLRRALATHGFDVVAYGAEAEPAYLKFSSVAYALGLAHRRLAPSWLRVGLIAWGRRRTG
jgi:SAM-dependent methyltransferase